MTRTFGTLLATSLRGLRSRWALTLGSLLLTSIAVASAVVGPSYQHTSADSFVISQLRAEPVLNTGVTYDYRRQGRQSADDAIAQAVAETARQSGPAFRRGHAMLWQQLPQTTLPHSSMPAVPTLLSVPGACAHVALRGRCPTSPGEIAMLASDAETYGLHVGSTFNPYGDATPFRLVGIYRARDRESDDAFWFGSGQLQSVPGRLIPNPIAARPAPWFTPQAGIELRHQPWYVTVDQRLDLPADLTPTEVAATARRVKAIEHASSHGALLPGLTLEPGNSLPTVAHRLLARRAVARSTVAPAVLSLVLVAIVLLSRLLAAAMNLRRGELALASLRGYSRRRLWFLGMLEPLLILAASVPIGVVGGFAASRALARRWLVPGLPVPFEAAAVGTVAAVVLVTALVAALVVRDSVNEPLSAQIAGVRRPTRAGRALVIVRLALVAAAVAALVTAWSRSRPQTPDATDLALPMLLAVAVGLVSGLVVVLVAGLWVRWSARRRGLSSYVASRTVRRRREGTLVVLPVTAALTVAVFTVGVSLAASTWRASAAATEVGAPLSYSTTLPLTRAVGLTEQLDPDGRWLMAAAVDYPNGDATTQTVVPRTIVDATRLARVASWPQAWTPGRSAADVAREIGPRRPPIILEGDRLTVTVDNNVQGDFDQLGLTLLVLDDEGSLREIPVGPFDHGRSTVTRRLVACSTGCRLETISFGGPDALAEAMHGALGIERFQVDGHDVPGVLDRSWHVAASPVGSPTAVREGPTLDDGALVLQVASNTSESYAGISPDDLPAVVPVLFGRIAPPQRSLTTGSSGTFRVRSVGTAESTPFRGPSGLVMDVNSFVRNALQTNSDTQVFVWARADTPRPVLDRLAQQGLTRPTTEVGAREVLDQDAFALALRLYTVVTVLVVLLALAGLAANLAVQLPSRRRDAASLRVVGVTRRSVMSGVVMEFLVVIGAAALAGVAAGALAQYVVVRSVTLGFADTSLTPRVLPSFHLSSGVRLSVVVLLVLLVMSTAFAVLTVRGARTSTLRENAR